MISLRQHAISLAAVFLALAIGVVLGSGFFSDTLLSSLRNEKRDLAAQITGLTDQRNALNEKLAAANTFDNQVLGRIVHDALAGKAVVIFRTPDANDDDVAMVSKIVGQAGGSVTGTVSLTQEFVEANSAEKLRSVVNSSILPAGTQLSTKLVDQGSQAGDLLGIALLSPVNPANPPAPPVDDAQRDTVLAALRETGFITYQPADHFAVANAGIVITGGGLPADAGNQGASVARFAAALAPHGSGIVLAGRDGSPTGSAAVAVTRADAGMAATVSTVDDVDAAPGRITAILALHDLINGGHPAHYGTGHRASSVTVPQ
ncbi:MAG: copper transporter [Mycobacterium pseudokansasii]|uniref:Copper transporter MctB n=1 Tax=Mycobacterium pseudokansasii TaxID=2341080 RepID=A0A498QT12_9MYCO|nr:copper transporter [Mycobacterium pseudokansasii]KZS69227.1 channel-forming protein [Mycobacterium kansasii]MBY0390332.1 copper transporter [Mycobacterium pseudokansasii]VAZ95078.1 Copper transporter MctB [Mycobacterium pseudokansasii]VAZ96278.1 Copper transporter MctB [Mycobacterium pseudokansasii]VBA50661.1 Copper transporter MctB [Mycobacterium pseudokansasii]